MDFFPGLFLFAALTLILWWSLQDQLGAGAEAHAHGDDHRHDHAASEADDLTKIEGIGPRIAKALNKAGINTYADLAKSTPAKLNEITLAAKINTAVEDSWPKQAKLASAGKWTELTQLQNELKGGRTKK
jgi:predicted flap endonuclease-1-like 5' DNA nuclease